MSSSSTGQWLRAACSPERSRRPPTPPSHLHQTPELCYKEGIRVPITSCFPATSSRNQVAVIWNSSKGRCLHVFIIWSSLLLLLPKLSICYLCQHIVIESSKPILELIEIQDKRTLQFDNHYSFKLFPSIKTSLVLLKRSMTYIFVISFKHRFLKSAQIKDDFKEEIWKKGAMRKIISPSVCIPFY